MTHVSPDFNNKSALCMTLVVLTFRVRPPDGSFM